MGGFGVVGSRLRLCGRSSSVEEHQHSVRRRGKQGRKSSGRIWPWLPVPKGQMHPYASHSFMNDSILFKNRSVLFSLNCRYRDRGRALHYFCPLREPPNERATSCQKPKKEGGVPGLASHREHRQEPHLSVMSLFTSFAGSGDATLVLVPKQLSPKMHGVFLSFRNYY